MRDEESDQPALHGLMISETGRPQYLRVRTMPPLLAEDLYLRQTQVVRAAELYAHVSTRCIHRNGRGRVRERGLMTAKGPGATLQSCWSVCRQERRIRNEYPVVAQPIAAAVSAIPNGHRSDCCRSAQIHLPPGIGIEIGVTDRIVVEAPVGVSIDCARRRGSRTKAGKSAALRCHFPQREIAVGDGGSSEIRSLVGAQVTERLAGRSEAVTAE